MVLSFLGAALDMVYLLLQLVEASCELLDAPVAEALAAASLYV